MAFIYCIKSRSISYIYGTDELWFLNTAHHHTPKQQTDDFLVIICLCKVDILNELYVFKMV